MSRHFKFGELMKVGDLVRHRPGSRCSIEGVGIIVDFDHPKVPAPDYRTPTAVLVFYGEPHRDGGQLKQEIWFTRSELELVSADR